MKNEQVRADIMTLLAEWHAAGAIRPGFAVEWSRREGCWLVSFRPDDDGDYTMIGERRSDHMTDGVYAMTEREFLRYAVGFTDCARLGVYEVPERKSGRYFIEAEERSRP